MRKYIRKLLFLFVMTLSLSFTLAVPQLVLAENGQFKPIFTFPKDKIYKDIATVFKNSNRFQQIINELNQTFILPEDIVVEFNEKDGPLYDPETKKIIMSYDFIFYLMTLYFERYPDAADEDMFTFALDSTTFLFYHEMAHAMIDTYSIPIISNEETAADNLAVIIALEYNDNGYNIVMNSADLFDMLDATNKSYDDTQLWDEHALDSQRFYNIICLTYGRYPDDVTAELKALKNKKLLKFIHERGDFCTDEYKKQLKSWLKLLTPHMI